MSRTLCLQLSYVALTCLLMLLGVCLVRSAGAACYDTPRTAIDAAAMGSFVAPLSKIGGYKVTKTQSDPLLRQRWAMVVSCDHPEWPASAFPLARAGALNLPQQPTDPLAKEMSAALLVHAGDVVLLWRQESLLRIEAAGIAEESGGQGKIIRARLLHKNTENQSTPKQVFGVVRGPLNVEMQP